MAEEQDPRQALAQEQLQTFLSPRGIRSVTDQGFGLGYGLEIGAPETPVDLLVFPEARGVIVASEALHVELSPIVSVSRRGDRLELISEIADERSTLEISSRGGVSLRREAMTESEAPQLLTVESGQRERVTIRGRVGRTPRFRTTQGRGMLISQFPLAEHTSDGGTVWHTVLLFGDRAQRLKDKPVVTGQEIEIVGYTHERTRRSRLGGTRQVTEVYATAVRTTLKDAPKTAVADE